MLGQTMDRRNAARIIRASAAHLQDYTLPEDNIFTLFLLRSGSAVCQIHGEICFIKGPTAICINERKEFSVEWQQCSDLYAIYFDPSFININMTVTALRNKLTPDLQDTFGFFHLSPFLLEDKDKLYIRLSDDTAECLTRYFSSFKHELEEQPDWYWSCRARSYFMDIIGVLERIYHNYYIAVPLTDECQSQTIPTELQNILLHINNHLESDLKLDDICQKFLLGRNTVERLFRSYLNDSFYGYIKNQRLDRVRYYLRFTELRAKEICHRVGFSSSQNLCKFFKSMTGMSPNQYRDSEAAKRKALLNVTQNQKKESSL